MGEETVHAIGVSSGVFFFQAEDGIRDRNVTGVQTCALPICSLQGHPGTTRALPRIVAHYFALDHRLAEICASFPDDPVMNAARLFCRGLRIIRQPKWECLATF